MSISAYLKNYRRQHNLKSKEMAAKLDMDTGTYSRLESGAIKKSKSNTIARLAQAVDITNVLNDALNEE